MSAGVLVVVPCLNEAKHLPELVKKLLGEAGTDDLVVVADGGSTDGSQALVEEMARHDTRLRLLPNPARLQSAAVNLAVERFGHDRTFLVRIDAHAAYPDRFVERLVSSAQSTGASSVVVPMRTVGETCFQIAAATAQNSRIGAGGSAHRIGGKSGWIDHGHHALMRIDAFTRIGGYDPAFSHNEDAEYDRRLTVGGGSIWFQADLGIDYFPRKTMGSLFRQYMNHGKGRARTVLKHGMPLKLRQIAPAMVFPVVLTGIMGVIASLALHTIFLLLAAPSALWLSACIAGGVMAARKSRMPLCGYLAGTAAMAMHLGWSIGFLSGRFLNRR